MYALVKYKDNTYNVCHSKLIRNYKGNTKATFNDDQKYPVTIIAKNDDRSLLMEIRGNILKNIPYILIQKLNFEDASNKKTDEINKNDNKTNIDDTTLYDIKRSIMLTNEDENIARIKSEKENCDYHIANLSTFDNEMQFFEKKDCDIKDDFLSHNNINPIISVDENENLDRTEIKKENSDSHITNLSTSFDVEDEESGSEYIPSEDEQNLLDDDDDDKMPPIENLILSTTASLKSNLDTSKINNGTTVCDDKNMRVEISRKGTKRNYCVFCMKPQTKLVRHLEIVHRNEPDVKKFAVLPKRSHERNKILDILRKNGNFTFNVNSELNNGQLIVCRRPKKYGKSATDFTACAKCKGFFAKNTIRHHSRVCFGKKFSTDKCIMIMGRKITCRLHPSANEILRKTVFPVMREDEVTRAIRYDKLLILYANKLCIKHKLQHRHDMIRAKLRLLGRFLLAIKDINVNIENFESIYHPKEYDNYIRAINKVAKYNSEKNIYETPAVAINLSTLIKNIGNVLITECIKRKNTDKTKLVKDFLKLLATDTGTNINTIVLETQSVHKKHKKTNLPSPEDIRELYRHLEKKRIEAFTALHQSFSYCHWISLAEITLTSIQIFNKRLPGEIQRVLIEDFRNYEKLNKNICTNIYKL